METEEQISEVTTDETIFGGEPMIRGTRTPVRAIVEMQRLGYSAEAILVRLPHLSLEQVAAALAYYQQNRAEIHGYIEQNRVPHYLIASRVKDS
ncbi:MAG TPA: DUF433 domain-containing protein [Pyrinomonadaceae bacterium]|jgi:uncharacterized protein (DUF433 family)|nr:DUF433 domain-containing protein [Pyrinomonadaceae bacterium]